MFGNSLNLTGICPLSGSHTGYTDFTSFRANNYLTQEEESIFLSWWRKGGKEKKGEENAMVVNTFLIQYTFDFHQIFLTYLLEEEFLLEI